ncbi:MAG TPA: hypothetical protein VFQ92_19300, partial [Blastocatellia bacterium]|nr:hypothetical protein [Blastocatellia bacterium]
MFDGYCELMKARLSIAPRDPLHSRLKDSVRDTHLESPADSIDPERLVCLPEIDLAIEEILDSKFRPP